MKSIVTAQEMRHLEESCIQSGSSQETLMDRAGALIAQEVTHFCAHSLLPKKIFLLAGKGNNAGDGYTAGRELIKRGFSVFAFEVMPCEEGSLCHKKKKAFIESSGKMVSDLSQLPDSTILDGIFGSGFVGAVSPEVSTLIHTVNQSKRPIIAIDIPSGLNATTGEAKDAIIAECTLTIELPKLGFFIQDGWNHVGDIKLLPIGIGHPESCLLLLEEQDIPPLLPKFARNCHKYQRGHVVGLAGSHGMTGAAIMASFSALKSGAGIVHLLHPEALTNEFSSIPWEIIRFPFQNNDLNEVKKLLDKATSVFVGPGLRDISLLEHLWDSFKDKAVLDAECLNWIAASKKTLKSLPHSILTPHTGEMRRLLNVPADEPITAEFLQKCQKFVDDNQTNLVLKGGPTFLFSYNEKMVVMPRGNPGMATAGSGDVLTGILASLLAQKLQPAKAMQLGTYLHGLAGEYAARDETSYCMTASSLIEYLPDAFHHLQHT